MTDTIALLIRQQQLAALDHTLWGVTVDAMMERLSCGRAVARKTVSALSRRHHLYRLRADEIELIQQLDKSPPQ